MVGKRTQHTLIGTLALLACGVLCIEARGRPGRVRAPLVPRIQCQVGIEPSPDRGLVEVGEDLVETTAEIRQAVTAPEVDLPREGTFRAQLIVKGHWPRDRGPLRFRIWTEKDRGTARGSTLYSTGRALVAREDLDPGGFEFDIAPEVQGAEGEGPLELHIGAFSRHHMPETIELLITAKDRSSFHAGEAIEKQATCQLRPAGILLGSLQIGGRHAHCGRSVSSSSAVEPRAEVALFLPGSTEPIGEGFVLMAGDEGFFVSSSPVQGAHTLVVTHPDCESFQAEVDLLIYERIEYPHIYLKKRIPSPGDQR